MIPIRDNVNVKTFPVVTTALIYLNVIGFVLELTVFSTEIMEFVLVWGLNPVSFLDPLWRQEHGGFNWFSLISYLFLHGSLMHLVSNMLFLWIFGRTLEDRMGHFRFTVFYLLAGVAAGFLNLGMAAAEPIPTIGASGAIAGLMGGHCLMFPSARVRILLLIIVIPIFFWMPAFILVAFHLFTDIVFSGVSLVSLPGEVGVATWAHIGGFMFGLATHRLFLMRRQWRYFDDYID